MLWMEDSIELELPPRLRNDADADRRENSGLNMGEPAAAAGEEDPRNDAWRGGEDGDWLMRFHTGEGGGCGGTRRGGRSGLLILT